MRAIQHDRRTLSVVKATKATKVTKVTKVTRATKRVVQHTWKVTRRNGQPIDITADSLAVAYGDLVFSTKGVVVRVVGVDTYNDVELISPLEA
jgi:hypothetical protein